MRIIIFNLQGCGHHIQFVNILSHYLIDKGNEVSFLTRSHNEHIKRLDCKGSGLRINFMPFSKTGWLRKNLFWRQYNYFRAYQYCLKEAQKQKADIVQFMYVDRNELALLLAILFSPKSKAKLFGMLIAPYFLSKNYKGARVPIFFQFYHRLNELVLKWLLKSKKIKRLFVLSKWAKKELNARWRDLSQQLIQDFPNPIDPSISDGFKKEARQNLGLPLGKTIFLYFGSLTKEKGPDIFLNSISKVNKEALWLIAGKPSYVSEKDIDKVKRKIKNPGSLIVHLRFIPNDLMKYYYRSSDVVVLPYRSNYIGTSGILEQAAGTSRPVIASDVGEIGQIVKSNRLGVVIRPDSPEALAEKMDEFISGEININSFKESIQNYAQKHNWQNMPKKIIENYELFNQQD